METAISNKLIEIKLSLNGQLKDKPYFFGIQNLEDGLAVIVEDVHDSEYVKKVIDNSSDKASISLKKVSSLDDYLNLFSNKQRYLAPDFLKVQQQVLSYLKSKTWSRHKLYIDLLILEHGTVLGVLEFLYLADRTLFLYKTGASRKHKEMRLRNRVLERAADFFEKRFGKYFSEIQAFTAYSAGRFVEVQPKFERKH